MTWLILKKDNALKQLGIGSNERDAFNLLGDIMKNLNRKKTINNVIIYIKAKLIIFFMLIGSCGYANMSSLYKEGTLFSSPFSSKDIHILSGTIWIKIDQKFSAAKYVVVILFFLLFYQYIWLWPG